MAAQSQRILKFWVCPNNYLSNPPERSFKIQFWNFSQEDLSRQIFLSAYQFLLTTHNFDDKLKKIFIYDPTFSSNINSGLANYCMKNHHIFRNGRTPAFIWHTWIPLKKFCNREKSVCVCIVLVHFGPPPQEINEKSVKLAVWAVSLIFCMISHCLW